MAEVLEERLGHTLSPIGTQRCLDCCAITSIAVLACYVIGFLLLVLLVLLFFFISGCSLVSSVNLCASRLLGDAPEPHARTPNSCPILLMQSRSTQMLACFPLPLLWLQSGLVY